MTAVLALVPWPALVIAPVLALWGACPLACACLDGARRLITGIRHERRGR